MFNQKLSKNDITFKFEQTKTGSVTCKVTKQGLDFYLHSKYNPEKEAELFIKSKLELLDQSIKKIIIYGIGCGYHIAELLKQSTHDIEVWESNIDFFNLSKNIGILKSLLENKRIKIKIFQSLNDFNLGEEESSLIIIHNPSLRIMPLSMEDLKEILDDFSLKISTIQTQKTLLLKNFNQNYHYFNNSATLLNNLKEKFKSKPVCLVSAGPSLQKNIQYLNMSKKHMLVACVGTAVKPLLIHGIKPDFIVITDPKDFVFEQIEGLDIEIPLFYLATVSSRVRSNYNGKKIMLLQHGFELAEKMAKEKNSPLFYTGGSVATTLFSLLEFMGFSFISLIGQDLAFTDKKSHSIYTHNVKSIENGYKKIKNYHQDGLINTSRSLNSYLLWFEKAIKRSNSIVYNCTEGGAYIKGAIHKPFVEFVDNYSNNTGEKDRSLLNKIILES